jgi:quercetin dioxygenase-like cupin family protein
MIFAQSQRILMKSALSLALTAMVLTAAADEPAIGPQSVRTIFERHNQTGVPGTEIVIGSAMLPPGTTIGYHSHPGDESGYVLKGVLVLHTRGQPDKILKAGDSFFNARGAVHSLSTVPGEEGGTAVSTWIVDKGQPLATAAP